MVCQFCGSENTYCITRIGNGVTERKITCSKCGKLLRVETLQRADAVTLEESLARIIKSLDDLNATLKEMIKPGAI